MADRDTIAAKVAEILQKEERGEVHIFNPEEVDVLRSVIAWVRFVQRFGSLGTWVWRLIIAIGGGYLMWRAILEKMGQ